MAARRGIFHFSYLHSLIVKRPIKANALLSERLLLNRPFKTENNAFKKILGDKKIQPVSIAASDKLKFVNRHKDGKSQEGNEEETRASYSPFFFMGVIFSFMLSVFLVVSAAGGKDEERKENLLRYRGRFMSQQKTCSLNNLAKAKLKRPIEKNTLENEEPETKRVTGSKTVSCNKLIICKQLHVLKQSKRFA